MAKCEMKTKDLGREELLNWGKESLTPVDIKEKGGSLYVRSLSGKERASYLSDLKKAQEALDKEGNFEPLMHSVVTMIILAACDSSGNTLFTEEDREAIDAWPANVQDKVANAAIKKNGIDADAVEDGEKN